MEPRFQFRISTILSWTAVVALLFGFLGLSTESLASHDLPEIGRGIVFFGMFFGPPLICIPVLIDHLLLKEGGLEFTRFWKVLLAFCVAIYSVVMLMLATVAFQPEWKGGKGMHWFYYTLDGLPGVTLWPMFIIGAALFVTGLIIPEKPRRSVIYLIAPATCACISFWYVFAAFFFNFVNDAKVLAIVPTATGICYAVYCGVILRNREYCWDDLWISIINVTAWFSGLAISIYVKYPLAVAFYESLRDEPPHDCFIVTAAARGHAKIVGSWYDAEQGRPVNAQLFTFWSFESWLRNSYPLIHSILRSVYNRVGPVVARMIMFRWQANCVYWLLKPLEWSIRIAQRANS